MKIEEYRSFHSEENEMSDEEIIESTVKYALSIDKEERKNLIVILTQVLKNLTQYFIEYQTAAEEGKDVDTVSQKYLKDGIAFAKVSETLFGPSIKGVIFDSKKHYLMNDIIKRLINS